MSLAAVYLAGVAVALYAIDAPPAARIGLALAWPIGPLAFLVTIAALIAVAAVAFPFVGIALVGLAALLGFWLFG